MTSSIWSNGAKDSLLPRNAEKLSGIHERVQRNYRTSILSRLNRHMLQGIKGILPQPRHHFNVRKVALLFLMIFFVLLYTQHKEVIGFSARRSSSCNALDFACYIDAARIAQEQLELRQSRSVGDAVTEYRRRYHRQPPPQFGEWVQFALENNATLIDEYDQLEADLLPYRKAHLTAQEWQKRMESTLLAATSAGEDLNQRPNVLEIKEGRIELTGPEDGPMSASTVKGILAPVAHLLPNVRLLYSFLATGRGTDRKPSRWLSHDDDNVRLLNFTHQTTLPYLHSLCPQRHLDQGAASQLRGPLNICTEAPRGLKNLHGFFSAPMYFRPIDRLVPIISRAKISTMTDILAANPCYAHKDYRQWGHEDTIPYENKSETVFWRGAATGIWMKDAEGWKHGHRQRYVSLSNHLNDQIANWPHVLRGVRSKSAGDRSEYLARLKVGTFDSTFTKLLNCEGEICRQFQEQFPIGDRVPPTEGYNHKIVADIDGQGMSCRFYREMGSNSVPLKQTVWAEWHDGRIMPWLHYVPLSLEMGELPVLVDWLLNDPIGSIYASAVAEAGATWARKSLRPIDITIQHYRMLLEFAHLSGAT